MSCSATARSIDVAQFADVAGPGVVLQLGDRVGCEALDSPAGLADELPEEMLGQSRHVVEAFAQRRHANLDDLQAIEQVLAKRPFANGLLQRLIRRGDDAHVDLDLVVAADSLERMPFEHAQELRLRARRHLADFVEEDRAVIGRLELADHLLGRAGECALSWPNSSLSSSVSVMAAQLSVTNGPSRRGLAVVNGPGDQFLAGPAFAANQHGRRGAGHAGDLGFDVLERGAGADEFAFRATAALSTRDWCWSARPAGEVVPRRQPSAGRRRRA